VVHVELELIRARLEERTEALEIALGTPTAVFGLMRRRSRYWANRAIAGSAETKAARS